MVTSRFMDRKAAPPCIDQPTRPCYNDGVVVTTSGHVRLRTSVKEQLQFYRLLPWQQKVSNARLLLYALLGYAIAGQWHLPIIALNTLALLGLIMFQGALNDYWDFRCSGEQNVLGTQIQSSRLTQRQAIGWIVAPLALTLPMFLMARTWPYSWGVPALLMIGAALAVVYSMPPARLKQRSWLGVLMAPLLTTLMFLEAVTVLKPATLFVDLLAVLLFLFQWYAELLHVLATATYHPPKWPHALAQQGLKTLPLVSGILAVGLALRYPIFWLSVFGAGMRYVAFRRCALRARAVWYSPLLSVYEFAGYGLLGLARLVPVVCCLLYGGSVASAQSLPTFERALEARVWSFPRDHGIHPTFQMEWWHVVGTLQPQQGSPLGFQATWFRSASDAQHCPVPQPNEAPQETFIFHGAVSDIARQRFIYDQQVECHDAGSLDSSAAPLAIRVQEHRLELLADGTLWLRSTVEGYRLALRLRPLGPIALNGAAGGLVPKGRGLGEAAYHASWPQLAAEGYLETRDGTVLPVTGHCWLDHEFGTDQLGSTVAGWDWMAATLEDGTALMIYRFRDLGGQAAATSFATIIYPDGRVVHLDQAQVRMESDQMWMSTRSHAAYPARWRVQLAAVPLELEVVPMLADQEMETSATTGITYWEGLCRVQGRRGQKTVSGWAYTELTGYAQALNGRL